MGRVGSQLLVWCEDAWLFCNLKRVLIWSESIQKRVLLLQECVLRCQKVILLFYLLLQLSQFDSPWIVLLIQGQSF